jgi:hypothetical protein
MNYRNRTEVIEILKKIDEAEESKNKVARCFTIEFCCYDITEVIYRFMTTDSEEATLGLSFKNQIVDMYQKRIDSLKKQLEKL